MHLLFMLSCLMGILSIHLVRANFYCHQCEGDRQGSCNFYRADPKNSGKGGRDTLWHVYCSDKGEIEQLRKLEDHRVQTEQERTKVLEKTIQNLEDKVTNCGKEKDQMAQDLTEKERQRGQDLQKCNIKLSDCSEEKHGAKYQAKVEENQADRTHLTENANIRVAHAKCQKDSEAYEKLQNMYQVQQNRNLWNERYFVASATYGALLTLWLLLKWITKCIKDIFINIWRKKTPSTKEKHVTQAALQPEYKFPEPPQYPDAVFDNDMNRLTEGGTASVGKKRMKKSIF